MLIPIRCFSCGKPIAHLWEEYKERTQEKNEDPGKVMDDFELDRYCCRRMLLGHTDLIDEVNQYSKMGP